ncbi:MAG TPA: hypothetical protein VK431_07055, partial [Nitrosopumilaceae archaeon]|nr:hypothetical protein [Nitrosopumilaceae archaeon]
SLPSKDKEDIYKLLSTYVNPSAVTQPFDARVDLTSGDGSVIQTWNYAKCDVTKYETYLQNNSLVNMLTGNFQPEIRDKIFFRCDGFSLEGQKDTVKQSSISLIQPINFVPTGYDRAQLFVVKFVGGDIRITHPFYTFGVFQPDTSASDSRYTSTPQIKSTSFTIASLPSKDKIDYYKFLSRYVDPTQKPGPFDASIEVVTGDGTVVETWQYTKCQVTGYQTYLQNSILYYTLSGKKAISETQDKTTFQCSGFSIKFGGGHEDLSQQQIIPNDDNRAIAYVTHLTSNEFVTTQTTGLVQEFNTLGGQQFQLESLPNKYNKNAFYLVSGYINPGVAPDLFDVTADLVTGDGTKLYSLKYAKCYASDYSVFLSDNIADIKFSTPIKSEIRGQGTVQCSGIHTSIIPQVQPTDIIGLSVQKAIGIPKDKLACKDGFQLMVRPPNNNTACIKDNYVSVLIQRGWEKATSSYHNLSNNIKPIIPTVDERAVSYRVSFEGTDISTQTLDTFSNFVPTSANSNTNPSGSFSSAASFYLQSLPSKDKGDLYKLISKYINPGVKPELFDVKVDVISGDNSILQTWKFGDCKVTNYNPYLDQNVLLYKFHLKWQAEIKDQTTFSCNGLNLQV